MYPCQAVVVAMQANNGQQRFFIGHTDKVNPLSSETTVYLDGRNKVLSVLFVI